MPKTVPKSKQTELPERIRSVALELRATLAPLVRLAGGSTPRPIVVAKNIGIDNTLSARLLRALRAADPLVAAREIPAPQGLGLFLDAAQARLKPDRDLMQRARDAVGAFESLIAEFPSGRAALDNAIAGWLPETRVRGEHAAKQAMFRAGAQLFGYTCDTMLSAHIIRPSSERTRCDSLSIHSKYGVRRLRIGPPISVLGMMSGNPSDTDAPPRPVRETLDGEREVMDARKYLLREYCRPHDLPVSLHERGPFSQTSFAPDQPPVNTPVTIVHAELTRNLCLRYREGRQSVEGPIMVPRMPARLLVLDVLLHEDVSPGAHPRILPHAVSLPGTLDDELMDLNRIELTTPVNFLGWGVDRTALEEAPDHSEIVRACVERAGWNTERFRVFRCRVAYPMPFIALAASYDLPAAPDDSDMAIS